NAFDGHQAGIDFAEITVSLNQPYALLPKPLNATAKEVDILVNRLDDGHGVQPTLHPILLLADDFLQPVNFELKVSQLKFHRRLQFPRTNFGRIAFAKMSDHPGVARVGFVMSLPGLGKPPNGSWVGNNDLVALFRSPRRQCFVIPPSGFHPNSWLTKGQLFQPLQESVEPLERVVELCLVKAFAYTNCYIKAILGHIGTDMHLSLHQHDFALSSAL